MTVLIISQGSVDYQILYSSVALVTLQVQPMLYTTGEGLCAELWYRLLPT